MKKFMMTFGLISAIGLCGCEANAPQETATPSPTDEAVQADLSGYDNYAQAFRSNPSANSYTLGARGNYTFTFSDNTTQYYDIDSVLLIEDANGEAKAHLTQNLDSDGIVIETDGYYYGGRLYNRYQNVQYYEDMSVAQLKATLQVPCDPVLVDQSMITAIDSIESDSGVSYVLHLSAEGAKRLYLSRYDLYGLNEYDGLQVSEGTVIQSFENGTLSEDKAEFTGIVTIDGEVVEISYSSSVGFLSVGSTVVSVPQLEETAYVYYEDIDVDSISEADVNDDRAEDTVEKTFRKRLVNRLGYTQSSADVYKTEFNDGESYTINFSSKQFIYENHTSLYTYNWQGNTGGFGSSCSYNFTTGSGSSNCQDSVLEMMPNIKLFFELELYYCGCSLDDLQSEANESN